jgi:arginase family enzyme
MADIYRFATFSSFCGVPAIPLDRIEDEGPDVVIIGAPIDWGATYRGGARFGPKAIRDADYLGADMHRPHLPTCIGHTCRPASIPFQSSPSLMPAM